jgi:hypothetical protein
MPAIHSLMGLREELERGADRIAAAVPIARAIIDGRKAMAKVNMPNLAGVAGAFDKLRHGIEHEAANVLQRIEGEAQAKADAAFKRVHARLDDHIEAVHDIERQIDEMDQVLGNGAPADSPPSSGEPGGG